jgi:hypothetical protein
MKERFTLARFKHVLLAGALISALGLFAAACDDDAETQNNAQQSDVDTLTTRIQRHEQMDALLTLRTLGLHAMDEALQEGTIESSFAPNTTAAIRVFELTDWGTHQADADAVQASAVDLLQALEAEDVDGAAAAAAELHEGEHDLSNAVWADLLGDLPEDEGGVEHHEDSGSETPADHSADDDEETPSQ